MTSSSSVGPPQRRLNPPNVPRRAPSADPVGLINLSRGEWPAPEFQPVERLGFGHFGEVWKVCNANKYHRALKLIRLGGQASQIEMRALEMVKRIKRHPNLINVSNACERGGFLTIEMDLADSDLKRRLDEAVRLGLQGIPVNELLENTRDAAKGLDHLNKFQHLSETGESLAVQHKDIKPANLLVQGGAVLIGDWSVAQFLEHTLTTLQGGCTPSYAAPELFDNCVTRWSDQYSLAVTYVHLRGGRLFSVGHECRMMDGRLTKPAHLTMMSQPEWAVVARALDKEPRQRWPDCGRFAAELAAAVLKAADVPTEPFLATGALRLTRPVEMSLEPGWCGRSLRVDVKRDAWMGPIRLHLEDLPEGVRAGPIVIPPGSETGQMEMRAEARAAGKSWTIRLVAVAGDDVEQVDFPLTVTADPVAQAKATTAIQKRGGVVTRRGQTVTAVRLSGTHVRDADLAILEPLADLQTLTLHQAHVTGAGLAVLGRLPRLKELHILSCTKVDKEWPKALPTLAPGLRELKLWWTEVSDEALRHLQGMTGLENLDLTGTEISDAGLPYLGALTGLKELNLSSTRVTGMGVEKLQATLPGLKIHF